MEPTVTPPTDDIDAAFAAASAALAAEAEVTATVTEDVTETLGPTAKEMAAAEEANVARLRALTEQQQRQAEPVAPEPTIIGLAAQGMDVLHDAIRARSQQPTHPEYVPPPRTPRQMEALQEELEAGRKAQARAEEQQKVAQQARAQQAHAEAIAKEGFTTPVHRPGDMVPDPTVPAGAGNFVGGTRLFGPDAP